MAESLPKWQIRQNLQPNSILFNFPCIPLRFDFVAHVSTGMTIRYHFEKTLDFDRQLYGLFLHQWKLNIHIETTRYRFDNNYNHEHVHLYSWCFKHNVKSSFS